MRAAILSIGAVASIGCSGGQDGAPQDGATVVASQVGGAESLAVDGSGVYFTTRDAADPTRSWLHRVGDDGATTTFDDVIDGTGFDLALDQDAVYVGGLWRFPKNGSAPTSLSFRDPADQPILVESPLVLGGDWLIFVGWATDGATDVGDESELCRDVFLAPPAGGGAVSLHHQTDGCDVLDGLGPVAIDGETVLALELGALLRLELGGDDAEVVGRVEVSDADAQLLGLAASGGYVWWLEKRVAEDELVTRLWVLDGAAAQPQVVAVGGSPARIVSQGDLAFVRDQASGLRAVRADGATEVVLEEAGAGPVAVHADAVYWVADAGDAIVRLPLDALDEPSPSR